MYGLCMASNKDYFTFLTLLCRRHGFEIYQNSPWSAGQVLDEEEEALFAVGQTGHGQEDDNDGNDDDDDEGAK